MMIPISPRVWRVPSTLGGSMTIVRVRRTSPRLAALIRCVRVRYALVRCVQVKLKLRILLFRRIHKAGRIDCLRRQRPSQFRLCHRCRSRSYNRIRTLAMGTWMMMKIVSSTLKSWKEIKSRLNRIDVQNHSKISCQRPTLLGIARATLHRNRQTKNCRNSAPPQTN